MGRAWRGIVGAGGAPVGTLRHDVRRAVAYMVAAGVMFSVLNASVKYLTRNHPTILLVWSRTAGHLLFVVAAFTPMHGTRLFVTRFPGYQLLRSVLLLGATLCYFTALGHVSLATAATISFTTPLIVATVAARTLGERVGVGRWTAVALGFIGVLVVIRPGADVAQWGSLLVLGSASCSAAYQLLTRRVAAIDPPETTVGYSALIGTVVLSLAVPFVWRPPVSVGAGFLIASLGVWGGLGHYLMARAYVWGPASVVSPFTYVQLLGAAAAGYLVFGDVPGGFLWLGAALIVTAGLLLLRGETRPRASRAVPG